MIHFMQIYSDTFPSRALYGILGYGGADSQLLQLMFYVNSPGLTLVWGMFYVNLPGKTK